MDRTFTLQPSGQMMVMPWQPESASHEQEKENFRNVLGSSGVLCCGRKGGQPSLGLSVSKYSSSVHELQVRKFQLRPCSSSCRDGKHLRRARRRALACCSVVNEVGQSSPQVPPGPASPDYLKDQLEALQGEALQVRNRYNNARARFMRLTEVAQQLRQRAVIDLNLGNEDSARKALIEKQKVIQAAELSKRRAQLLEVLSIKLGEAISVKETQYIVAFSIPQREEPTVRLVSPKGEGSSSVDLDLDKEGNPTGSGTDEAARIGHESIDLVDPAVAVAEDTNGDSGQVEADSAGVLVEREILSLAAELGYSTDSLCGNDEDLEATALVQDSHNMNLPLGREEFVRDDRDMNVQSGGSLLPKDHGDSQDGVEQVGTACQDGMDHSERSECEEASGEASFNDGRGRLLERLMLDVDHQIAAVESRLKTELSTNMVSNDTELQLVEHLLEKVQSLRARISEVVVSLAQNET